MPKNQVIMKTILRSEKKTVTLNTAGPLIIIGEKINPTGRKKMAAALQTAQEIGVKHFIIEDESPTVLDQITQSLRYLESLAW